MSCSPSPSAVSCKEPTVLGGAGGRSFERCVVGFVVAVAVAVAVAVVVVVAAAAVVVVVIFFWGGGGVNSKMGTYFFVSFFVEVEGGGRELY